MSVAFPAWSLGRLAHALLVDKEKLGVLSQCGGWDEGVHARWAEVVGRHLSPAGETYTFLLI